MKDPPKNFGRKSVNLSIFEATFVNILNMFLADKFYLCCMLNISLVLLLFLLPMLWNWCLERVYIKTVSYETAYSYNHSQRILTIVVSIFLFAFFMLFISGRYICYYIVFSFHHRHTSKNTLSIHAMY